ncbi:hypothetical protein Patl1_00926 [Pistacia atlantica]|uniref:Uncharacterized protein n=1 Tax=Pistacia atlantica TaxID=434234 RepID=A0ACC1C970_9ROSI|nr:hypothetical protein Patl1_00926 [Pistacia atlantica]
MNEVDCGLKCNIYLPLPRLVCEDIGHSVGYKNEGQSPGLVINVVKLVWESFCLPFLGLVFGPHSALVQDRLGKCLFGMMSVQCGYFGEVVERETCIRVATAIKVFALNVYFHNDGAMRSSIFTLPLKTNQIVYTELQGVPLFATVYAKLTIKSKKMKSQLSSCDEDEYYSSRMVSHWWRSAAKFDECVKLKLDLPDVSRLTPRLRLLREMERLALIAS